MFADPGAGTTGAGGRAAPPGRGGGLGEPEERLPNRLESVHRLSVDLDQDVSDLKARRLGASLGKDDGDGGWAGRGPGAPHLGLGLGLAQEEPVLRGHPVGRHRLRHGADAHLDRPPPLVVPQHGQGDRLSDARRRHVALQGARVHDGAVLEGDHQIPVLEPGRVGGRFLHDVHDESAEPLAEPVLLRDLVHLLLREIADAHAEPPPACRRLPGDRAHDRHEEEHDRERSCHGNATALGSAA